MSILTLGSKKEKKENSPIKEWEKAKKEKKENFQSKRKSKRKERKFPTKEWEKVKKEGKKVLDQRTRRNVQKGLLTRQYLNNTELSPNEQKRRKGNHDLKWSSPFDYQPKSRALATFFPRPALKKKKNRKRKSQKNQKPKNTQSQIVHQENPHSQEKVLLIHDHACNL